MKKKIIRLTENDLYNIINNTVNRILMTEYNDDFLNRVGQSNLPDIDKAEIGRASMQNYDKHTRELEQKAQEKQDKFFSDEAKEQYRKFLRKAIEHGILTPEEIEDYKKSHGI